MDMVFTQEEIFKFSSNAIILILFCVVHSLLAREFMKTYLSRIIKEEFVRFAYVLVSVFTMGLVLYSWRPLGGIVWHAEGMLLWGLSIFSFGCVLGGVYSIVTISYMDFLGLRPFTPSTWNRLEEQPGLSTKGPYAYCRHPMYLFFGLAGFSKPVMSYGDLEFLFIATIYVAIAIPFEEGNLRKELGSVYDTYILNVPKIIPRCSPWKYNA
jgi:protein-S-isoprenylcysteine O-methyltransferase Ste14